MRFEGKFRISNTYIVICFRQNMLKVLKRGKRKMQYQWFVFWSGLFDWLIFSVSLFVIADNFNKLHWKIQSQKQGIRLYELNKTA